MLYSHPWSSVSSGEKVLHMVPPVQMTLLCNLHPSLTPLLRVSYSRYGRRCGFADIGVGQEYWTVEVEPLKLGTTPS